MEYKTAAANAFGSGNDLIGMRAWGQVIVSATRKNITLADGTVKARKGTYVTYEVYSNWEARKKRLNDLGYDFFQSLKAGPNSSYSWSLNSEKSAYACESEEACIYAIEHKLRLEKLK